MLLLFFVPRMIKAQQPANAQTWSSEWAEALGDRKAVASSRLWQGVSGSVRNYSADRHVGSQF